ncbi:hypothetical protein ANCDUO_20032 [Ancylostoma duodenale]|uniref:Uncharacterized protein n=1 Tax=Ancylostoma duodenale TaxID=51022 RepID=A0A0C2CJE9_9BILA|nr:hypothetical protein ANCDUO_20032 [Ancylostoma duodenale]
MGDQAFAGPGGQKVIVKKFNHPVDWRWMIQRNLKVAFQVNINPSYQSEELRFALGKVDIKALITPPGFKKSNYYQSVKDVIPEIGLRPPGRSDVSSSCFPVFRHLIIFGDPEDKPYPYVAA